MVGRFDAKSFIQTPTGVSYQKKKRVKKKKTPTGV